MKIILQSHLKIRLQQRNIPPDYPKKAVINPDARYFDKQTTHLIAVKKLEYSGEIRPMAVSYDLKSGIIQIITIHPISQQEIKNKIKRKRWIKYEKN